MMADSTTRVDYDWFEDDVNSVYVLIVRVVVVVLCISLSPGVLAG